MKGRIKRIARTGMAGRKKDTLLLMIVITMSFFFTVLAIILQGSFQKTRDAQRLQLYGVWHAAYLTADDEVLRLLEQEDAISAIGKSYIYNTGTDIGFVGTYNQQLLEMGRFKLIEGSFPQKPGEIALESSKLAMLGLAEPIGEEISVVYQFVLKKASNEEMIAYRERVIKEYEEKLMQEGNPDDMGELLGSEIPWYDGILSDLVREYKHRKIDWEYMDNGVVLTLSNLYHINYFRGDTPGPEEIREQGLIEESILRVTVPYKISGVISDYSERWDVSYYPLANAFITEEAGRELEDIIRNTSLTDNSGFKMDGMLNLFLFSDSLGEGLYQVLAEKLLTKEEYEQATGYTDYGEFSGAISSNNIKFRKNKFAYPLMEGSTEETLLIVILVIIFIATVVSVFQIFLSQIKRRSRKIALLKSIGATNGQIVSLMAWEGAYLLLSCLPAGALSGAGVSYLVLLLIRLLKGSEVIYYLDFQIVGYALLAGSFSVILGMIIPVIYASGTPLTGTITKAPRHNTQRMKKLLQDKKSKKSEGRQSFAGICMRHISLNKGKTLLNLAISAITISILISSVFICYVSFADYNKTVAIPDRPDYTLEVPYGVTDLYINHYSNALKKIPGIKEVTGYRRGANLHLYHQKLENDELINDFYRLLPEELAAEHFAPAFKDGKGKGKMFGEEFVDKAMLVNMYGIDIKSDYGRAIMNSISDGRINKEDFEQGKEVILVLPAYRKTDRSESDIGNSSTLGNVSKCSRMKWLLEKEGGYALSLNKRYRNIYDSNFGIGVGDTVILSADEEIQQGDSIITNYTPYEVKVAGIISYFPGDNIWPFSDTAQVYAVIGSSSLFESLYKASNNGNYGSDYSFIQMLSMFKSKFGNTVLHIYADKSADRIKTDTRMIEYANALNATLYNYRESNHMLYKGALNNALIIGLLGFATSVIAILILFNILTSTARQERHRIGILQSIGVTGRQQVNLQIANGLINSLVSLAIAHIIVILVMFLTPFGQVLDPSLSVLEYILDVFRRLQLYPWTVHLLICILFTAVTVFVYYLTSIRVIKSSPIENMRA